MIPPKSGDAKGRPCAVPPRGFGRGVDEQLELRTEYDRADAQAEAAEQLHRIVDAKQG